MALAPIRWNSKIVLAKIETTYGIDPTPTGAANAMLLKNVELQPMNGSDVSRNLERAYMGAQEEYATGVHVMLTAEIEMVGSGETGVAPGWSPAIRCCGIAEVVTPDVDPGDGTVEYTPVTDNHESATFYIWIGPTLHKMLGVQGTVDWGLDAQGFPVGKCTWTGLFVQPSAAARPTADVSAFVEPQIATTAQTPVFTLNGVSLVAQNWGMKVNNDVKQSLLIGRENVWIADRNEEITMTVEAVPLGTLNPYLLAENRTRVAHVIQHGNVAGKITEFSAPRCALKRPSYTQIDGKAGWQLAMRPMADVGDDQWTMTLR